MLSRWYILMNNIYLSQYMGHFLITLGTYLVANKNDELWNQYYMAFGSTTQEVVLKFQSLSCGINVY